MDTLAIVPSTDTFEAHFTTLGVRPEDLADGVYRGTWITRYADDLQERCGIRCVLVVPSRSTGSWSGKVMDVRLTRVPAAYPARLRPVLRGPVRPFGSYLSSTLLPADLERYPVVYLQEYAYGRAAALVEAGLGVRMIAAHHGTSVDQAPRWVRRRLPEISVLTGLTRRETDRVRLAVGGTGRARVVHVPNWVEDSWFRRLEVGEPHPLPRVLWCGRMENRNKDLTTLLRGFRGLRKRRPAELVLVGDGPDRGNLEGLVRSDAVLGDSVRFTGRLDDVAAVQEAVAGADVVVNTSRIEGFPLAVLEAGAVGRPLVLSALPYVTELTGLPDLWLFPPGDAGALATVLETAIDADKHPYEQCAWVARHYSPESSVTRLSALIRDVAAGREPEARPG